MALTVDLSGSINPKPGEVFIPGGVALLGGDETNLRGRDLHEIDVPPFYMATFPVSFQEYFEFLAAMFAIDPLAAPRFLPRNTDGSVYWVWTGENVEPTQGLLRWGEDHEYLLSLPAFGVDLGCAEAYARWKSESTGRRYRLPTEDEWEKAARGTDGRRYPWGDRFDASFCKMRESRPDLPAPEPCGTFPSDISPYGVRDMAGGIAEWVLPSAGDMSLISQIASRGGAWCDWRVDCYLGARRAYFIEERSARVGFRLVREVQTAPPSG
jgi:serine/threonine-protein kinase